METWEIIFIVAAMLIAFIAETLAHHADTGAVRTFTSILFCMASFLIILAVVGMLGGIDDMANFFNQNFDVFGKIEAQLKPR